MRKRAKTETAKLKARIQALVRAIVIKRDRGCFLKGVPLKSGNGCSSVLQADHLISRGKNVGYADTRLIICLCSAHHTAKTFDTTGYFEDEIRARLPTERVELWARVKKDQKAHPMDADDWAKEIDSLNYELGQMI